MPSDETHLLTPGRRKVKGKQKDSFFDLPLPRSRSQTSSPVGSPQPVLQPLSIANEVTWDNAEGDTADSLFARLVLTPIMFISFIFSWAFVNRRDRLYRVAQHPQSSSWSWWSPKTWIDPEPYQDPLRSTWDIDTGQSPSYAPSSLKKRPSWYAQKKHRKLAKMQLNDALDMRGQMIVLFMTIVGLLLALVMLAVKRLLF